MPTPTKTLKGAGPSDRGCLDRAVAFDLLADDLPEEEASSVRAHVRECMKCAEILKQERRFKARIDAGLAAGVLRKFYGQLQNRVEYFDEREINTSEFALSVHEAMKVLEPFGGIPLR